TFLEAARKGLCGPNLPPFPPIFTSESVNVLGLQLQTVYLMSLIVSVAMMAAMAWFFGSSKHGLAMRATAFDQQVAQSLGISVKTVFAMAWAISAVVSPGPRPVGARAPPRARRPPALRTHTSYRRA